MDAELQAKLTEILNAISATAKETTVAQCKTSIDANTTKLEQLQPQVSDIATNALRTSVFNDGIANIAKKEDISSLDSISAVVNSIQSTLDNVKSTVESYSEELMVATDEVVSLKDIYNELASNFSQNVTSLNNKITEYITELKAAANVYVQGAKDLGDAMNASSDLVTAVNTGVSSLIASTSVINEKVQMIQENFVVLAELSNSILSSVRFNTKAVDIANVVEDVTESLVNVKTLITRKGGDL